MLGLRSGEVRGLRWEDIDGGKLHVRAQMQRVSLGVAAAAWWDTQGERMSAPAPGTGSSASQVQVQILPAATYNFAPPKSRDSTRELAMPETLIAILAQHRHQQRKERLRAGARWELCDCGAPVGTERETGGRHDVQPEQTRLIAQAQSGTQKTASVMRGDAHLPGEKRVVPSREVLAVIGTAGANPARSHQHPWGLVFPTAHGLPMAESVLRKAFHRACIAAGVRDIRFHDLRHIAASFHLATGATAQEVSYMLGHHSIAMTLDIYAHLLPDRLREATQRAGELLWGAIG